MNNFRCCFSHTNMLREYAQNKVITNKVEQEQSELETKTGVCGVLLANIFSQFTYSKWTSIIQVAVETNVAKKNKINELFDDMRNRNIYILCEPFRPLSEVDAEDRFEMIAQNTSVGIDLPKDIQEYLRCLLSQYTS